MNYLSGNNGYDNQNFLLEYSRLIGRLTVFPVPTVINESYIIIKVACMSGHSIAGGFCLALCHDYRLMREGPGDLYMNEV